jgi:hypothetical protein
LVAESGDEARRRMRRFARAKQRREGERDGHGESGGQILKA